MAFSGLIELVGTKDSRLLVAMEGVIIKIGWEYFLGIIAGLIAVAWYSSSRFTALETSMDWVKGLLKEVKLSSDNSATPAFAAHSPVNLTATGEKWLNESGLKEYIDANKDKFLQTCQEKKDTNPYEVQKHIFKVFDELPLEVAVDDKLKAFAFSKGTTMGVIRRVGAIYLRNLCLESFGMQKEDIDKHNPEPKNA